MRRSYSAEWKVEDAEGNGLCLFYGFSNFVEGLGKIAEDLRIVDSVS
jgi:hypothetical protein